MTSSPSNKQPPKRHPILTFFYGGNRNISPDAKNVLLVASTLIAAVTFQTGVNPPGSVWQDSDHGHEPGRAIYGLHKRSFAVFLICNTFAFSVSVHLVLNLMVEYPFFLEIFAATTAMFATYWASIYEITPEVVKRYQLILVAAVLPYAFQVTLQVVCLLKERSLPIKKLRDKCNCL